MSDRLNDIVVPRQKCTPTLKPVKELKCVWTSAVRPSRRPLRGLLRMRDFLNAITDPTHPEERPKSLPQARTGGASRRTHDRHAALSLYFFTSSFAGVTSRSKI